MRRNIKALLVLAITILTFESVFSKIPKSPAPARQACNTYTWFEDEDLTAPVGTMCDVNVEVVRLQNLYGGYVFSSAPEMGLHGYEYGWNQYLPTVVIYSDR